MPGRRSYSPWSSGCSSTETFVNSGSEREGLRGLQRRRPCSSCHERRIVCRYSYPGSNSCGHCMRLGLTCEPIRSGRRASRSASSRPGRGLSGIQRSETIEEEEEPEDRIDVYNLLQALASELEYRVQLPPPHTTDSDGRFTPRGPAYQMMTQPYPTAATGSPFAPRSEGELRELISRARNIVERAGLSQEVQLIPITTSVPSSHTPASTSTVSVHQSPRSADNIEEDAEYLLEAPISAITPGTFGMQYLHPPPEMQEVGLWTSNALPMSPPR